MSSSNTIIMKRHDTRPFLDVTLKNIDGDAVDLSISGISVNFTMKDYDTNAIKTERQACTLINAIQGQVRYSWQPADTNAAGTYLAEFEVNYADNTKITIPTSEVLSVVILEDYDNA